jgi:hypothetical protein
MSWLLYNNVNYLTDNVALEFRVQPVQCPWGIIVGVIAINYASTPETGRSQF